MAKTVNKSDQGKSTTHPVSPDASKQLTFKEQTELVDLEQQITTNNQGSFALAAALAQICAKKLYREKYKTFEKYCKAQWEYSRSYCHRLCKVYEVQQDLKELDGAEDLLKNEGQARVFVDLEKSERVMLAERIMEADSKVVTTARLVEYKKELFPEKCISKPKKSKTPASDTEIQWLADKPQFKKMLETIIKISMVSLDGKGEDILADLTDELKNDIMPWVEWEQELGKFKNAEKTAGESTPVKLQGNL